MQNSGKIVVLLLLLFCVFPSTGNAQATDDINLTKDLVGYYPFNGSTEDKSGNGNNLTASDEGNNFGFDRNVSANKSASFDNSILSLKKTDSILKGHSDFTLSIWARLSDSDKQDSRKILFANDTINGFELALNKWTTSKPVPEFHIGGRLVFGVTLGSANLTMPLNFWHHFVLSRENGNISLFLNNELAAEGTTELPINGNGIYLGGRPGQREGEKNPHSWSGELDDVRLYQRALSAVELSVLHELE